MASNLIFFFKSVLYFLIISMGIDKESHEICNESKLSNDFRPSQLKFHINPSFVFTE